MKSSGLEQIFILRSPSAQIFGHRSHEVQPWRVEVTLKARHGVHYLLSEVDNKHLSFAWLKTETHRCGIYSTRPFMLGMPVDGSMDRCVYALMQALCVARGAEPYVIWREANPDYDGFTSADLVLMKRQAEWEGVIYPRTWAPEAVDQLIAALRACGDPSLADVIQRHFGGSKR